MRDLIVALITVMSVAGCAEGLPSHRNGAASPGERGGPESDAGPDQASGVADAHGKPASCTNVTVDDSQTDDPVVQLSFQGTGWQSGSGAGKHGSGDRYSDTAGDSLTVAFRGTSIKIYGSRAGWHGIAEVSLDGGEVEDVDYYGSERADQVPVYERAGLADGDHELVLTVAGRQNANASGSTVTVDRVDVCTFALGAPGGGAADGGPPATGGGTSQPPQSTIFVKGWRLYDSCGEELVLRGVNAGIAFPSHPSAENLPEVAKTGANAVRLTFRDQINNSDSAQVDTALQKAIDNKMVPIPALWDATGDWSQLGFATDFWTAPDMVAVLKKHEAYTILNVANEAGTSSVTNDQFRQGYTNVINSVRGAGLKLPILIDAANWGRNEKYIIENAAYLLQQDPEKNLVFSWHPWDTNQPASRYAKAMDDAIANDICMIVGEFSSVGVNYSQPIDYKSILQSAQQKQIGWLWWWWSGGDGHALTADAKYGNWVNVGEEICVSSPNGIAKTAVRTTYLETGACK